MANRIYVKKLTGHVICYRMMHKSIFHEKHFITENQICEPALSHSKKDETKR